jgi:lysophospholipase L1-like esterase
MDWNCGQDELHSCYVNSCGMETFELYIEHLQEIYSIIFTVRAGKPTMVRAFDAYNPRIVQDCTPDGAFEACLDCFENYNKAIHQAADEMGVPVANVFDAWNGPDHTEDPNAKGYTKDGVHPNETVARVIADLLRAIGYEMIIP